MNATLTQSGEREMSRETSAQVLDNFFATKDRVTRQIENARVAIQDTTLTLEMVDHAAEFTTALFDEHRTDLDTPNKLGEDVMLEGAMEVDIKLGKAREALKVALDAVNALGVNALRTHRALLDAQDAEAANR